MATEPTDDFLRTFKEVHETLSEAARRFANLEAALRRMDHPEDLDDDPAFARFCEVIRKGWKENLKSEI